MYLIDTHAHLYHKAFKGTAADVIARSQDMGIERIYLPNINQASVLPMLEICKKYKLYCYGMLGLHPCEVEDNYLERLEMLKPWLDRYPFAAIGEVGMDLHWDSQMQNEQEEAFRIQVGWAMARQLPLSIHCRKAMPNVFRILEEKSYARGVIHCFTGTPAQAEKAVNMGLYIGFGGIITFQSEFVELVRRVPIQHIILETDSPYLTPRPYRGQCNEPAYLWEIAKKVAILKDMPLEEVARITTANAKHLFDQLPRQKGCESYR